MTPSLARQRGYTLTELIVVVVIIAFGASIALPSVEPSEEARLQQAAKLLDDAIQFARSEAIRSGLDHGVSFDKGQQRVRLYYLSSGFLGIPQLNYVIRDPVTRNLYDFDLDEHPAFRNIELESVDLYFEGSGTNRSNLGFNSEGAPKYEVAGRDRLLTNGQFVLSLGSSRKTLTINPVTGRGTIQ